MIILDNDKYREITPEEEAKFQQNIYFPKSYEELVEEYIRERYSISDELALLRQKDTKQQEFSAYYEYAEECKHRAKTEESKKMLKEISGDITDLVDETSKLSHEIESSGVDIAVSENQYNDTYDITAELSKVLDSHIFEK